MSPAAEKVYKFLFLRVGLGGQQSINRDAKLLKEYNDWAITPLTMPTFLAALDELANSGMLDRFSEQKRTIGTKVIL